MNVLSLFDGISCGQIALERAGVHVDKYYASEIDKYAIQITQKNYPKTIQLGDVNNIDFKQFIGNIDLVIGDSPCQDLSISKNNRLGLNGDKSILFYKFAEAINIINPKYFLLENVSSMKNEDKELISEILGVEPICINSSLLSAQQRKRLYWTNIKNISQPKDKEIKLKDILTNGLAVSVSKKGSVLNHIQEKSHCLMARDYKGFGNQPMTGVLIPLHKRDLQSLSQGQLNRVYSVKDKRINDLCNIDLPDGLYLARQLSPLECERLQTLPDNYTNGISNTQRYKCIGNGWTVDVISHILKNMATP